MSIFSNKKIGLLIITGLTFCMMASFTLDQYGQKSPKQDSYDAIVVLGCRVMEDGEPSQPLQERTRLAVKLWKQGYASKIVLTGGLGNYAPSEAQAALRFAIKDLGVDQSIFLLEDSSTSTEENAGFTKEHYPEIDNILLVSDAYHIFRSERVFGRYFENVDGIGAISQFETRVVGGLREVLAVSLYFVQGRL